MAQKHVEDIKADGVPRYAMPQPYELEIMDSGIGYATIRGEIIAIQERYTLIKFILFG